MANECPLSPTQVGMALAAAAAVAVTVRCSLPYQVTAPRKSKLSSPSASASAYCYRNRNRRRNGISAVFWEWASPNRNSNSKTTPQQQQQFTFRLTTESQQQQQQQFRDKVITVSFVSSISEVPSSQWDACALDATDSPHSLNPFLTHAFFSALEDSGSASKDKGWRPHHIVATATDDDETANDVVAVVPLYLKTHSYGEFVFDHAWANAYYTYGSAYYPKLQSCVPFTPVTGPRILLRNTSFKHHVFDFIVSAMKDLTAKVGLFIPLLF